MAAEQAGAIGVDERMRAADGLWAIGDVTGKGAFTHVSLHQAAIAVVGILGQERPPADYRAVPRVTFTDPQIARPGSPRQRIRLGRDVRARAAGSRGPRPGELHGGVSPGSLLARSPPREESRRHSAQPGGLGLTAAAAYLGGHLAYIRGVGVNHTAFQEPVTEWTDVAALADLPQDKPVAATAAGVPVVLVRRNDQVRALSATCVHAGGPLAEGTLTDGSLRCPWHGSIFRLCDGKALRGPAATAQPAWQVRLEEGRVLIRSAVT